MNHAVVGDATWLSLAIALGKTGLHVATIGHYGHDRLDGWLARELGGGRFAQGLAALTAAFMPLVIAVGLVILPLAVPVFSPEGLARYSAALGVQAPREERQARVALSQHFADRFGWENLVATVARVYHSLPSEDRARAAILTGNYGEAGAIDFFGPRHGLPKAISGHNNYWLWGPRDSFGEVVVAVGVSRRQLGQFFDEVVEADVVVSDYAMAYETNLPVYVCRRPKRSLTDAWPTLKRYI